MFLNSCRWHYWLLNKNSIGFEKWFSLVILSKYCVARMAVRYGTSHFLLRSNDTLVRYAFFAMVWVRLVWYAFVVMVRVRYVGTLFEIKIPDFLHITQDFCMQRQKTAEADAKCVN